MRPRSGKRCWALGAAAGMANQARGRRGDGSEERLEQGERVAAIPVPRSMALLPPQVPASFVAGRSRAASSYLCSLIMFSSVHMFPYIVNLTFSRCSFCEREKSERTCHSVKTFIFTASFPLEDVQACSSKRLFSVMGQGIGSYSSKWCLHLGCEACIITAHDIFFPILTPENRMPQWEIASPPCDKTVCFCFNFQEPGTCSCSEGPFEVLLHLSGSSFRGKYRMYFY